ncbi:MAG: 3-phosphoshikimate 1-carboxyvinyltransferase [Planctomycetes bacterium]|nr:3-phosphoshikimate 1-carboxyvinyltransferase [Planctomycetota bacterium]
MHDPLEITSVSQPVRGRVQPPGSKSITNRALVCAALAHGVSTLRGALDSEDTRVMIEDLRSLGFEIDSHDAGTILVVRGADGRIPALEAELFCANSGTTMRFLTALTTLGHGSFRLDGVERMRARPIGDLLDALNQLGAQAVSENDDECPPVVVHANGLPGGAATVRGDISSQFLSALLMAAPYALSPVELTIEGRLVSVPYVDMTRRVMQAFGVDVVATANFSSLKISNRRRYRGRDYAIEPDASAASYFFAAAAITGGCVRVDGLSFDSLQGDVAFVECLKQMGAEVEYGDDYSITVEGRALKGIDVDMNAISDTVQTLAVVALFADGATTIRNVAHIRHKETDRIAALATELRKLGATVTEWDDGLTIDPGQLHAGTIETYNDHRMAMSFALAGLRIPGVRIANPKCVEKTYPNFFRDLTVLISGQQY